MTLPSAFYPSQVQAVIRWLGLMKLKANAFSVNDLLQHHPDWPSLLCISDALHQWNVPHLAAKAPDKQLPDTHCPFVAVTNHPERPLAIVTRVGGGRVQFYQYSYNTLSEEDLASFVQRWTGVYLLAEPNAQSGEPDFAAVCKKWWLRQALPMSAVLLMLALLTGSIWPRLMMAGSTSTMLGTAALALLYVAGLVVSGLLLWYEIDQSNPLLKKVCTGLAKTNCHAILNSKASKLFGWLSWSELGFAYFFGGLLLLTMPVQAPWAFSWLCMLGIAAILYPVFSIFYQWRVARQWCVLCLAVQAILFLQAMAALLSPAFSLELSALSLSPSAIILIILAYSLPLLSWLSLKPWLLGSQSAKQEQKAYKRLKYNPEVFECLLKGQRSVVVPKNLGIRLGRVGAPNTLTKVCNPYCGPCSDLHLKIARLLEQYDNLEVQIIFLASDSMGEPSYTISSHLLALSKNDHRHNEIHSMLDDWYSSGEKNYSIFAAKFLLRVGQNYSVEMTEMTAWCLRNDIRHTPTIFLNGNEIPSDYTVNDLPYFLQE